MNFKIHTDINTDIKVFTDITHLVISIVVNGYNGFCIKLILLCHNENMSAQHPSDLVFPMIRNHLNYVSNWINPL